MSVAECVILLVMDCVVCFAAGFLAGFWRSRYRRARSLVQTIKSSDNSVNIQCGRDLKM